MFEYHNNILGVHASVLYDELALMSYGAYQKQCNRNKLQKLRNACAGKKALVRFDKLPREYKDEIVQNFGDPYKQASNYHFEEELYPDAEALEFFENFRFEDGRPLTTMQIEKYRLQAEIFNAVERITKTKRAIKITLGGKVTDSQIWQNLVDAIHSLDTDRYPHKLNKNARRLKANYEKYKNDGYQGLIHGNHGNDNSLKITGELADWLLSYYCLPNKPGTHILHTQYNKIRKDKGWPKLSESAINMWLNKQENKRIWTLARHGKEQWSKEFGHHIKRDKAKWFPNAYWAVDGSKIDWIHYEDSTLGMAAKLKINPLIDVYSEKILGWSFSETEDHTDHFKTIKMAVNNAGARPYLLTYDNQSGHKSARMQELYTRVIARNGGTHYPHRAYRKSNPIEQVFNRLQQQVINSYWFSDGQSIKVRNINNAPNMDFIKSNKHKLYRKEELVKAWELCVKEWNESKHPHYEMTREEVYAQDKPMLEEVGYLDMVEMFWITQSDPITYKKGGLRMTVANKSYEYEVYTGDGHIDTEFRRKYVGAKMIVKYDPDELDNFVRLFTIMPTGALSFVANAQPKRAHETIPVLMQEGDKAAWRSDFEVSDSEYERDLQQYRSLVSRTGIDGNSLIEQQDLMIKMGGDLPKKERSSIESQSFLSKM